MGNGLPMDYGRIVDGLGLDMDGLWRKDGLVDGDGQSPLSFGKKGYDGAMHHRYVGLISGVMVGYGWIDE